MSYQAPSRIAPFRLVEIEDENGVWRLEAHENAVDRRLLFATRNPMNLADVENVVRLLLSVVDSSVQINVEKHPFSRP